MCVILFRVHYPLPLRFDSNPSVQTLQNTISRLRAELAASKPKLDVDAMKLEMIRLIEDNKRLKSIVNSRREELSNGMPIATPVEVSEAMEALREEIRALRAQLAQKDQELQRVTTMLQLIQTQQVPELHHHLTTSLSQLENQNQALSSSLSAEQSAHRTHVLKYKKAQQMIMAELDRRVESEKVYRERCRKLMEEVDTLQLQLDKLTGETVERPPRMRSRSPAPRPGWASNGRTSPRIVLPRSTASSPRSSVADHPPLQRSSSRVRDRSPSPLPNTVNRPLSASRRPASATTASNGYRSRSPSPMRRFNPTAYIQQKQQHLAQTEYKRWSEREKRIINGGSRGSTPVRGRSRSNSVDRGATVPSRTNYRQPSPRNSSSHLSQSTRLPSLLDRNSEPSRRRPVESESEYDSTTAYETDNTRRGRDRTVRRSNDYQSDRRSRRDEPSETEEQTEDHDGTEDSESYEDDFVRPAPEDINDRLSALQRFLQQEKAKIEQETGR